MLPLDHGSIHGPLAKDLPPALALRDDLGAGRLRCPAVVEPPAPIRRPVPGRLFRSVKLASWVELCLFAGLLVVWIAPGLQRPTFYLGLGHGIGFIALCLMIWLAVLRREAPYPLLAATLTPLGPVGSVIGIALIERRGWGIARQVIDTTGAEGDNHSPDLGA